MASAGRPCQSNGRLLSAALLPAAYSPPRRKARHDLHRFAKDVYALPGVAETCDIAAIKGHYFGSHPMLNPSGVVPKGPEFDLAG